MAKAKTIVGLDCDGSADAALKLVLVTRMEEMCEFGTQAQDFSDPMGVHDMRVASRRLRGAIRDFLPYLSERPLAPAMQHIKKLARALGRVRDFDVAIETLMKTADKAPETLASGIRQIADFRKAGLEEFRLKLLPWVGDESLSRLRSEFPVVLKPRKTTKQKGKDAAGPLTYREVARAIILIRLSEFEELSRNLYQPLKPKPLHALRIAAKHLRYALELFDNCWPELAIATHGRDARATSLTSIAKHVSLLQTDLGDLHDCDVWIDDFGSALTNEVPNLNFDYKATTIWLMSHFLELRNKNMKKAWEHWAEWERQKFSSQIRTTIET
ncbi:MAG TPA: CHAD domain-containing protein [Pyrinomonadaceae bacterium]|nr:CHAD domain-containing protein [Pyrinomonadaceae bacterium]